MSKIFTSAFLSICLAASKRAESQGTGGNREVVLDKIDITQLKIKVLDPNERLAPINYAFSASMKRDYDAFSTPGCNSALVEGTGRCLLFSAVKL